MNEDNLDEIQYEEDANNSETSVAVKQRSPAKQSRKRSDEDGPREWFPFHVRRWLTSETVRLMSLAAQGLFVRLLCLQWDNDGLPEDPKLIARVAGMPYDSEFRRAWASLEPEFPVGTDGRRRNATQDRIRHEQNEKHLKRVNAGRLGGEAKSSNARAMPVANACQEEKKEEQDSDKDFPNGKVRECPSGSQSKAFIALLPETHRTAAMGEVVRAFFKMRSENRFTTWKPSTMKRNADTFASFPAEVVVSALAYSTDNQYQGVFPADFMPGGKHGPKLVAVTGGRTGPASMNDRANSLLAELSERGHHNAA